MLLSWTRKTAVIAGSLVLFLLILPAGAADSVGVPKKSSGAVVSAPMRPVALTNGITAFFRNVSADIYMTATFTESGVEVRCESADGAEVVKFKGDLDPQPDNPDAFGGVAQCAEPRQAIRVEYAFTADASIVATEWTGAVKSDLFGLAWYRVAAKGSGAVYEFPAWKK